MSFQVKQSETLNENSIYSWENRNWRCEPYARILVEKLGKLNGTIPF
jgi:hypothetical protein